MISIQQKSVICSIALAMFFLSATAAKREIKVLLEDDFWKTIEIDEKKIDIEIIDEKKIDIKIAKDLIQSLQTLKDTNPFEYAKLIKKLDANLDPKNIAFKLSKFTKTDFKIDGDTNTFQIQLTQDNPRRFEFYASKSAYIKVVTDFNKNPFEFQTKTIEWIKDKIQKKVGYHPLLQKLYKNEAQHDEYKDTETPNENATLYLKVIPDAFLEFKAKAHDGSTKMLYAKKTDFINRLKFAISENAKIKDGDQTKDITYDDENYKNIKFKINGFPKISDSDADWTHAFITFGIGEESTIINVEITAPENLTFPEIKFDEKNLVSMTWKDLFGTIQSIIHKKSVYADHSVEKYVNTNLVTPISDFFNGKMANLNETQKKLFIESVLFNAIIACILAEAIKSKAKVKPNDFSGEYIHADFKLSDLVEKLKQLSANDDFFYKDAFIQNKNIKIDKLLPIIKDVITLIFGSTNKTTADIAKYYGLQQDLQSQFLNEDLALNATSYFYEFFLPSQNKTTLEFNDVLKNLPHLLRGLYLKKNQFPWIKHIEKKATTPIQQNLKQLKDNLAKLKSKLTLLNGKLHALHGQMLAHH